MEHRNFVDSQTLEVDIINWSGGSNVSLIQSGGSMYFQFSMTPDTVRALAADLIAHAERVEAQQSAAADDEAAADAVGAALDDTPCPEAGADQIVANLAQQVAR